MSDASASVAPSASSGLRIALLGPPIITADGAPIDVDTRKAIALLAYLATTGQPHSRDTLVGLLWGGQPQSRARAALRRTLSVLNKALGGRWLDAGRDLVGLDWAGTWSDVSQFEELVAGADGHGHAPEEVCRHCIEDLGAAVELHRGDFMEGFALRDAVEFDDWHSYQAARLRRQLGTALERLVRGRAEAGQAHEALAPAERWLRLDPLNEPAHRWLMLLYAWTGDRAAAVARYRECVVLLDRELGVAPLEETTELYESILEDRVPPPRKALPSRVTHAEALPPPPLVGRDAEREALLAAHRAASPDGLFAVVEGEAGIGKTRLVEEVLAGVGGARVVAVRCHEEESGIPFGPFADAVRAALAAYGNDLPRRADRWLAEISRLVPDVVELRPDLESVAPLTSPGAQAHLFQGVVQILEATLATELPGVLFIDDLQWADDASLEVLGYLVRRLRRRPMLVVAAYRPEGLSEGHPVPRLASRADVLLSLERLTAQDVVRLVRETAGGDAAEEIGARLYEETEGLPFFCVSYLQSMSSAQDEPWELAGTVREALTRRLEPLSGPARQVLTTAAIIGRSFDVESVLHASGRTEEETVAALEELVGWRLVSEDRGAPVPSYAFAHERLRAVVYDDAGLARRRLLHRRIADALARRRDRRQAAVVAHHYREAGRDEEAAEWFKSAGDEARSLFAHAEALQHYATALGLGHARAAEVHESIADLLTLQGAYTDALRSYGTAAALARDLGEVGRIEHKLGSVHLRRGDFHTADAHLRAAAESVGDADAVLLSQALADRSLAARHLGALEEAAGFAHRALELAEAAGDPASQAKARNALGLLARASGDLDGARAQLEMSLRLAEGLPEPALRIAALNNLALTLGAAGHHDAALEAARTALGVCAMQGDRHREAALLNNIADLLRAAGRADDAMSHLKEAVSVFAEVGGEAPDPGIWKLMEW